MSERRELPIDKYFLESESKVYEFDPPLLISIVVGYCGSGYMLEEPTTKVNAVHDVFNVALEKLIARYLEYLECKKN